MIQIFKKLILLLSAEERKNMYLLLLMILIMALLDMIGVASILPFMAVLTNPDIINTNLFLKGLYQSSSIFGVENNQQFLFVLGILVLLLLVISLSFKAITIYVQVRFVQMRQYSIGKRLVEGYLQQPYSWFLGRHSANLGKTILSEVEQVVGGGLLQFMNLIATGVVAFAIVTLLIIIDPKLAFLVGLTLCLAYGLIFNFTRKYLKRNGQERLENNEIVSENQTKFADAYQNAKEHREPWPGGRANHYLFDLNRDWAWATQIESTQRLKIYNKWI